MTDDTRDLAPAIITLPTDGSDFFPILDGVQTISMKSGLVTLHPGESVGEHSTGQHEEALVILEGTGEVEAEGMSRQRIEHGQMVYIPPKTRHNVFNSGDAPLRYIFVVARIP